MLNFNYASPCKQFSYDYLYKPYAPDSMSLHMHDGYEIFQFLNGDATYYVEGSVYKISHGDILITNSAELHTPVFESKLPYERRIIQFKDSFISDIETNGYNLLSALNDRPSGRGNIILNTKVEGSKINTLFDSIHEALSENKNEAFILAKVFLLQILIELNTLVFSNDSELAAENHNPHISNILEYINLNISEKITLEDLEKKFYINKYHLCHIFKETTGLSIGEYISAKRIMLAKKLLKPGKSMTETASECGFNDYSNFYKTFKKLTGLSPKDFISG